MRPDSQRRQLGETMLRISGARQILLEMLGEEASSARPEVVALNGGAGNGALEGGANEVHRVKVGDTTDRE